jgi:hypothetical protein
MRDLPAERPQAPKEEEVAKKKKKASKEDYVNIRCSTWMVLYPVLGCSHHFVTLGWCLLLHCEF